MANTNAIPYSRQHIDDDDIHSVVTVLKSDYLTQGPNIAGFEEKVATYCGSQYAVSFNNGTAALHAACSVLGIKENDEGIVPPITFVATANCLLYNRAKPVFADVTKNLPLIDPEQIEKKISPKTKVILPVHFAGSSCNMEAIGHIAKKNNLAVIEDACHALGASYKDTQGAWHKVGDCHYSDMTIFSFHPVKSITTGEGGMITTNNKSLYDKLVIFRQHGIVRKVNPSEKPEWYYEMQSLGFNYRLTDIQAALGLSQLNKLDRFVEKRRSIFEKYREDFSSFEHIQLLEPPLNSDSAFHLSIINLKDPQKRDLLYSYLKEKEIMTQLHYIPVYQHPYYQEMGYQPSQCPNAEHYFSASLSLPNYYDLNEEDRRRVVDEIRMFFKKER